MILTENDYGNIAAMIGEGCNVIWYDKGDETLVLSCIYETDGYIEDDYFNGTGAYIETARRLTIGKAECYDSDGHRMPLSVDEERLEKYVA